MNNCWRRGPVATMRVFRRNSTKPTRPARSRSDGRFFGSNRGSNAVRLALSRANIVQTSRKNTLLQDGQPIPRPIENPPTLYCPLPRGTVLGGSAPRRPRHILQSLSFLDFGFFWPACSRRELVWFQLNMPSIWYAGAGGWHARPSCIEAFHAA